MEVFQAVQERRAVKGFDPTHKLTESEIEKLMQAARLAPTAFNIQNWRFLLVLDPEQRKKIRAAAWDQAQVSDASLVIVMCADLKSWEKNPRHYWRNASEDVQNIMTNAIHGYYDGKGQVQRDEAMRSIGIAAQTLMLMAKDMGYDSCPMDGFDFDAVGKIVNLPSDYVVGMMVAIGRKTKEPHPRSGPVAPEEVIFFDRF